MHTRFVVAILLIGIGMLVGCSDTTHSEIGGTFALAAYNGQSLPTGVVFRLPSVNPDGSINTSCGMSVTKGSLTLRTAAYAMSWELHDACTGALQMVESDSGRYTRAGDSLSLQSVSGLTFPGVLSSSEIDLTIPGSIDDAPLPLVFQR